MKPTHRHEQFDFHEPNGVSETEFEFHDMPSSRSGFTAYVEQSGALCITKTVAEVMSLFKAADPRNDPRLHYFRIGSKLDGDGRLVLMLKRERTNGTGVVIASVWSNGVAAISAGPLWKILEKSVGYDPATQLLKFDVSISGKDLILTERERVARNLRS